MLAGLQTVTVGTIGAQMTGFVSLNQGKTVSFDATSLNQQSYTFGLSSNVNDDNENVNVSEANYNSTFNNPKSDKVRDFNFSVAASCLNVEGPGYPGTSSVSLQHTGIEIVPDTSTDRIGAPVTVMVTFTYTGPSDSEGGDTNYSATVGEQASAASWSGTSSNTQSLNSFTATSVLTMNIGDIFDVSLSGSINISGQSAANIGEGADLLIQIPTQSPPPILPDIAVNSVSTADAQKINLYYSVSGADVSGPFQVAIYRSPTSTFNINTAVATGLQATIPATDSNGAPSTAQGTHQVRVNLGSEIPIDPTLTHPYLFVVANPPGSNHIPESDDPSDTNDVTALGTITFKELASILGPIAAQYVGPLNEAIGEFSIITPERQAAFLGQIAVESAMPYGPQAGVPLSTLAERPPHGVNAVTYFDQKYNGKLGNIPGSQDGYKFRGQGPLMLTGRTAYTAAQSYFDFSTSIVTNPSQVSTNPEIAFLTSAWFWSVYSTALTEALYGVDGMNDLADSLSFTGPPVTPNPSFLTATANLNLELTRIITGPGVPQSMRRWAYYVSALTELLPLLPQDQQS